MPFNNIDAFKSVDAYKKELKKELGRLDATLGDFYFYDDYPINGSQEPVLVVGEVKPPILKALKSGAKAHALGKCFIEGSTLKLTLTKGKMPEVKLKPVFKGIPFDFKLVSGDIDAGGAETTDARFEARLQTSVSQFDKIKGGISDGDRKELRILFGQIQDLKDTDVPAAGQILAKLDTRMQAILKEAAPAEAPGTPDAKDEKRANARFQASTRRLKKALDHLTGDQKTALKGLYGNARKLIKNSDWIAAHDKLVEFDASLIGFIRQAAKTTEGSAGQKEKELETLQATNAMQTIRYKIEGELTKLKKLEAVITNEAKTLSGLEETLAGISRPKDIEKKQKQVDASEERLQKARKILANSRGELNENVRALKAAKLEKERDIVTALGGLQSKIRSMGTMLADVPIEQARNAIEATIRKMAEATEWREEQFKKEAAGGEGHGTARHGAQTGLDRQARRAATQDGVTPEQPDNPTGVSQTVEWNKVKITYTEEAGKRVVADRDKLAQTLATEISNTQFSGGVGSSWANPVLEKEAVDKALAVGRKLMGYTHYTTGNTSSAGMVATNFTNLTVVLDEPTSGPGWGYAVTRKGTAVDPVVATAVLKRFEEGKITLDKLFSNLNVELIEKPNKGGVLMVPRCKVILTRATETDDWKLKTHYPDHKLELKHEGWECERGQPKGDVTLRKGDVLKVFDNKVLP
ncbi:MAG: hypothetical protein L3J36_10885 [Rhodobacteraceae bacterium]|nr:hypothetical protein [Paracoccaceae bacterium]